MAKNKVISIAEKTNDSRSWDARQCIQDLLNDIDAGKIKPEKLLILYWQDVGNGHLRRGEHCVNI